MSVVVGFRQMVDTNTIADSVFHCPDIENCESPSLPDTEAFPYQQLANRINCVIVARLSALLQPIHRKVVLTLPTHE